MGKCLELFGSLCWRCYSKCSTQKTNKKTGTSISSEQKRVQDEENKRPVVHFKCVQTALKNLGFYKSKVDSDFGSGSQAAHSKYLSAFCLPFIDPVFLDLFELEERAETGWKSGKELNNAKAAGCYDRHEYMAEKI